jgi:hypothetical protein
MDALSLLIRIPLAIAEAISHDRQGTYLRLFAVQDQNCKFFTSLGGPPLLR